MELVDRALAMGLEALAISDHDTFAGYDQALAPAREYGLARGTEIAPVLGEASNNALLVRYELIAEPEHVVGAGLLVGLTSTEGFLRARGGQHR